MNSIRIVNSAFKIPVDVSRQLDCVRHYTDREFSAFMFNHGTWTFSRGDRESFDVEKRLSAFKDLRDFRVREMDDGNFVVGFGEDFFAVVLKSELEELRPAIAIEIDAFDEGGEQILTPHNTPRDHLFIGLLARSRLIQDVADPSVLTQLKANA